MNKSIQAHLSDYFRLPADWKANFIVPPTEGAPGFFHYGSDTTCFGHCANGAVLPVGSTPLHDASRDTRIKNDSVHLSFDPGQVIDSLRNECYLECLKSTSNGFLSSRLVREAYYSIRKFLPVPIRRQFQKAYLRGWKSLRFPRWPIDFSVDNLHREMLKLAMQAEGIDHIPFIWFWPEGKSGCVLMTHDVETVAGRDFTATLMDLDDEYGIKGAFQVIPEERYAISEEYVRQIQDRGFEFNIHDLNHDGNLYRKQEEFIQRVKKINQYGRQYNAQGFRAGAMYRNQEWYSALEFSYDMSVPNVAHLEPKRGGCCTVFPYFVGQIVEFPLTTAQDYSVFHILDHSTIKLWRTQLHLLRQYNGLMSILCHPDYLMESRTRNLFECLLQYLRQMIDRDNVWAALPRELNHWWRARGRMKLVRSGNSWKIEGEESHRARLAMAELSENQLVFRLV